MVVNKVSVLVRGVASREAELTNTPSPVGFKVGAVTGVEAVLSQFVRPVGDGAVSLSAESLAVGAVALFVSETDVDVEVVDTAGPIVELVEADESGGVTGGILCFCGKLVVVTVNIEGSVSTIIPVDLVRVTKEEVVWMCSSTQPTSPSLSSSKAGSACPPDTDARVQ